METITTNKKIIQASTVLLVLLSLFVFVLFVNEIRASKYIGRGNAPLNTISFSGKGEVTAVSDIATLSVTVSKDAATTTQAQSLLNDSVTKTLSYLKDQKIEDKDIKSEYGGINPKYASNTINCFAYPCPQPEAKVVGYTATQSITVKIRAVDTANEIRTGLANLGITNISGPNFSIDDEDTLRDQARALAIKDAKEKAEILADQLGVRLGSIANFSDNTGNYYPMYDSMGSVSAKAQAAPAPELPKGENKITSTVTITYEIK